ncbi:MAG: hypothetical protein E6J65_06040 [Deltaproteobacteria bacterium]|nr:MAG: hypothetical protein E6J65_06040 [Deltaproteobacteria bacterium]
MVVQGAVPKDGWGTGLEVSEHLTPRQTFCAPLLSALLFGGGNAGISDIYVHIRDIVPLSARDWESNPLERRLARWHTSLARALNDFVRLGVLREEGHARWGITEKGFAVAREFTLVSNDGVLIDRAVLRKRLPEFAVEFEKIYKVYSRPGVAAAT